MILNWTTGPFNAISIAVIIWVDGATAFFLRGHRDNMVNWSGVIMAASNGAAATFTALKIVLPEAYLPDWIDGPLVMFCMLGATAMSAIVAVFEPFTQALGVALSAFKNINLGTCLPAIIMPILTVAKASYKPLKARIVRILQGRSKAMAQADLHKEKAGNSTMKIVYKACVLCELEVDETSGVYCCGTTTGQTHAPHDEPGHEKHGSDHKDLGTLAAAHAPGLDDAAKPPHFTCSACLTGHGRLHLLSPVQMCLLSHNIFHLW